MKRYIKLNGRWIDTNNSAEMDIYYYRDGDYIWRVFEEDNVEECCGLLENESDEKPEEADYL